MLLYVQLQRQEMAPAGAGVGQIRPNPAAQLRQDGKQERGKREAKRRAQMTFYCAVSGKMAQGLAELFVLSRRSLPPTDGTGG
jgi:hypothetical protein